MENLIIYSTIAYTMYLIFRKETGCESVIGQEINRRSDATIEVVAGRYILTEK